MPSIPLHLVPAYGADYRTSTEAISAWKSGKDFKIMDISSPWDGAYCSCRDFLRSESVMIRFNKRADYIITGGLKRPPSHTGVLSIAFLLITAAALSSSPMAHAQYVVIQPPPIQAPAPIPSIPPYVPMPSTVSPFIPQPVQPLQIPQYQSPVPSYTNCAGVGAYLNCTTR